MRTDRNFYKVLHVLRSCRTQDHFNVAHLMMGNYIKMNRKNKDIQENIDRYMNNFDTLKVHRELQENILGNVE